MTQKTGKLQAVVFDWAGTMIDFGSRAPAAVFEEVFRQEGVPITTAQAREPMGMAKREHLRAVLEMPDVAVRWETVHGQPGTEADIDRMYEKFLPLQKEVLGQYSRLIPGATDAAADCRRRGLKIGSSTGYTHELMDTVLPLSAEQGYEPDCVICAGDTPAGRPKPWMLLEAARQMDVYPMDTVVKVDDTLVGIEAGHNAGCWTVAITMTGNELGLSEEEAAACSPEDLAARESRIREKFSCVDPHFVVAGVSEMPQVLDEIESRIANGERP